MNDQDKVTLAQTVKSLQENLIAMLEYEEYRAKIIRHKYLKYIEQGFTEAQALELCTRV
jgi:hypothetical protein